ncbi:MAG TPA: hypothetical protein VFP27_18645 [Mycobacterium sp.]|nr:hypothetical protein [Mycobacterium sp.]
MTGYGPPTEVDLLMMSIIAAAAAGDHDGMRIVAESVTDLQCAHRLIWSLAFAAGFLAGPNREALLEGTRELLIALAADQQP